MLLHALAKQVGSADARTPALEAFRSGYDLLAKVQTEQPDQVARLVSLPNIGAWAYDCIARLDQGLLPDYGYLASVAAAAALRAGIGFELDVPVYADQVRLPGLGCLDVKADGQECWARLRSDGDRLTVDDNLVNVPCEALVPDVGANGADEGIAGPDAGGGAVAAPGWSGTPLIRAMADGHAWDVLLEVADANLDRYPSPAVTATTAGQLSCWRSRVEAAWQVLARQRSCALDAFADTISVIVPLAPQGEADFDSVTTPAAFGAVATSWPPDPVVMAEMLVHEFQHLKLCALLDMVPLVAPGGGLSLVYAPWRQDPRPASGLLQGVYAHLAIARFWGAQQAVEDDPDDLLRAQVLYERWRPTIESAADTLLGMEGCLTPKGAWFVEELKGQGRMLEAGSVASAQEMADEVALDHWLTWQLRHVAVDRAAVAEMAAAFARGGSPDHEQLPASKVEAYTRRVSATARSRMLNLRHREAKRFRHLRGSGELSLSRADCLLIDGRPGEAAQAYREQILTATEPAPDNWVGLALAASRLAPAQLRNAFATRLPLMFEIHRWLAGQGVPSDPMDLAAWLR